MHSKAAIPTIVIVLLGLGLGCADFKRGEYWDVDEGEAGDEAPDGAYTYADDVFPVLDSGCERCHAQGNSAGNTNFLIVTGDPEASYESTLEFVDLESPSDSRLLAKMSGSGHGGAVIYDDQSAEYDLTLAWIEQGAPP